MTQAEFEERAAQSQEDLKKWWDSETEDFDAAVSGQGDNSIWGSLPAMDSKAAMKASPTIEEHFEIELDPNDIRRGGYSSFDDFFLDITHKLRARCVSADTAHAVSP